ncbi:RING-H2 finger protein ATL78 [Cajanus cajan]|uniref:RING-type E3 ubiquitin transferase n=1 Tax=Cajanus cajan TaxID=3821 RepID=A0A151TLB1_CAJCA|nr:RING-H2 finger protein ATL78 [Cajanus cajan]KYP67827.1 RING-H2 finger protein ATL1L [Cajanus cajan]
MYASTSFTSQLVHDLLVDNNSRKLLQNPLHQSTNSANSPDSMMNTYNSTDSYFKGRDFDANVVMILSVLLCAVICSLGLNSIIKCILRCSNIVINDQSSSSGSHNNPSPRLANTGIKKKALKTFPTVSYSTEVKLPGLDTECVICLSEFTNGEKVRILPKCNHGFHVRCIDKWLSSHSSCPKCRQCLIETCKKIVGSQQPVVPAVPETIIRIQPLEPEGLERNYREGC